MTAYCQAVYPSHFWLDRLSAETGSSAEAERLTKSVGNSFSHYLSPRLDQLAFPIVDVFAASQHDEAPVSMRTAQAAIDFALLLPRTAQIPEISADPDGEISFDWISASGRMFSVSVSSSGKLSYAGWFGEDSRVYGTEKLADAIPEQILRGVQKASRQEF